MNAYMNDKDEGVAWNNIEDGQYYLSISMVDANILIEEIQLTKKSTMNELAC